MKGLGGLGDIAKLIKHAGEMKKNMAAMQEQMTTQTVTATSGGGMVTVTVNGKLQVVDIKIDPEVVDPNETAILQDLILAAVAEGQRRAQELIREKFTELTGGIDIEGMFKE